jgi:uncharacterized protein
MSTSSSKPERIRLSRRTFIVSSFSAAALGAGGYFAWAHKHALSGTLLSAFEDARGDQYVGGVALDQNRVFGAKVPMRAHGCALDPRNPQRIVFFARRPGTEAFELHRDSMQVRAAFATGPGRHLAGHGAFSAAGDLLFVPEHDYEKARGIVTVRDARNYAIVHEIDTQGIDPHEVAWLPDGRTLLVANGGILTHPRSFRRKLNIPTMDPSLCAIDANTGACLEQWRLPDHLLSIRHLALTRNGVAAAGLQYEGDVDNAPGIVALHRPGAGLRLLAAPPAEMKKFKGYVASVAISEQLGVIAAACPYGNGIACWSLHDERYLGFVAASETYGLSRLADGSIAASQRDGTAFDIDETRLRSHFLQFESTTAIRWDDHWVAVA